MLDGNPYRFDGETFYDIEKCFDMTDTENLIMELTILIFTRDYSDNIWCQWSTF